jgi:anti-sigma-K factor RskA
MNEKEFAELAAGHALRALSAEDERSFQAAVVAHPEWAALADADVAVVSRLAAMVDDVQPPPALKAALFARLDAAPDAAADGAPQAQDAVPDAVRIPAAGAADDAGTHDRSRAEAAGPRPSSSAPRRGGRASRTWFALAASIALLLGVGVGVTSLVQNLTRPASVVALDRIQDAPDAETAEAQIDGGGEATLHWSESLGQAVLVSDGLPSLASDQTFELWYIRGDAPIPAGTFDASSASTTAVLEPGMQPGDTIAVTIEQEGGSPDGTPTTDPIVVISTA